MEFLELVKQRRSTRTFTNKPVEDEKLQQILKAANAAPSAGDLQAYEIYLVRDRQKKLALARAALEQFFLAAAPVALVFCAHPARSAGKYGERGASLYTIQDATIACTFAMLAVVDQGLATVWVGAFDDQAVRGVIGVGEDLIPVAILPVGYAGETPEKTSRRRLSDLVREVR